MASYLTLAEYSAFLEKDGKLLTSGVVDTLRKESFLLDKMQFPTINALKARAFRVSSLAAPSNRQLNENYTHSTGAIEPIEETGYLFGGRVSVDHQLEGGDGLIADPNAWQVKMKSTSLAYGWNDDMINGSPSSTPNSITGLRFRIARDFSGQIVDAGAPDISPDSAGLTAAFNTFFDAVQSAIYKCREHTCDLIITNATVKLRMESGLRQLGLLSTTQDSFGRTISTWGQGGPAIIDIGLKYDQSTSIMPDTEGATGLVGGGAKSSLFFVKLGAEYLTGWQKGNLQTFETPNGVLKHVDIDWLAGIAVIDPRSVAWLYNVTAA